jgi:hypothetical protein
MTSLISSFIIDPFVRQARRFSQAPAPAPAARNSPRLEGTTNKKTADGSHANRHIHAKQVPPVERAAHDDCIEHAVVNIYEDEVPAAITETQSNIGGDAVTTAQLPESTVTPSTALVPSAPRSDSDEPLRTPENASIGCQTLITIIPHETSHNEDMAPNRLLNADNENPPTSTTAQPGSTMSRRATGARDGELPTGQNSPTMSSSLPADDGMRNLREKIHTIRAAVVSQEEKARQMHDLMTEEWHNSQLSLRPQSPASVNSQERPYDSPLSTLCSPASPRSTLSLPVDPQNPYNIHPEDLQPSYRPLPEPEHIVDDGHDDNSPVEAPEPVLGCKHYQRNVKIQCFDCKTWHSCRHCHDAAVPSHHLNRRATQNMLCMQCWTPQAAGQYCKNCNERGAWYYCDICKLWDDDGTKRIYHCSDCGICRRGEGLGKDFVHCKVSNLLTRASFFRLRLRLRI